MVYAADILTTNATAMFTTSRPFQPLYHSLVLVIFVASAFDPILHGMNTIILAFTTKAKHNNATVNMMVCFDAILDNNDGTWIIPMRFRKWLYLCGGYIYFMQTCESKQARVRI